MKPFFVIIVFFMPSLCSANKKSIDIKKADILHVLSSAVKSTRLIDSKAADLILVEAASYQACLQNYNQAKKTACMIRDEEYRSYAFYSIALNYAKNDDLVHAFQFSDCTTRKCDVLKSISILQAEHGDIVGAENTAMLIRDDLIKGMALLDVAIVQAKIGNQRSSLELINKAKNFLDRFHDDLFVIEKLAEAYAFAGNLEEGYRWFKLLRKNYDDAFPYMLENVALGYATAHKYQMAFNIIKQHPDSTYQGYAIYNIGMLLLSRNDEENVQRLLLISDWTAKGEDLLFELIEWNIKQQKTEKALKYVEQLNAISTLLQVRALFKIASLQQIMKQPLEAEKTSLKARKLIEGAKSYSESAEMLTYFAEYQALCQNAEGARHSLRDALNAARKIDFTEPLSGDFDHPIHDIFLGQVQIGDIASARETLSLSLEVLPVIKRQQYSSFSAEYYKGRIVSCYTELGDLKTALQIASTTDDIANSKSMFASIGETLGREGDLATAMKVCHNSVPDSMKAQMLISVVKGAIKFIECKCDDPIQRILDNAQWSY